MVGVRTYLGYHRTELVQISESFRGGTQLSDPLIEFFCSRKGVLLFRLLFCLLEEPHVFYQPRFDSVVVQILGHYLEFFLQELVCEIHLKE